MAITASPVWHKEIGTNGITQLAITATDITLDNSYPTGGEAVTAANLGLVSIIWAQPASADGYTFEFDHANSKIIVYAPGAPAGLGSADTDWIVADNDDAATDGVAVYVHIQESAIQDATYVAHLEAVSPGNSDILVTQSGIDLRILDDDAAATGGAALFVAPAGAGFYANMGSGGEHYIQTRQGGYLAITNDADPATNQSAVQVYVDHDAAIASRMQAVVVDNANETVPFSDVRTEAMASTSAAAREAPATADFSGVTTRVIAYGPALA